MSNLLDVRNLTVRFSMLSAVVYAVNDLSYAVEKGETLGIVGESGSGKSVQVLSMLGLIPCPPGRIEAGEVWFEGVDLLKLSDEELREIRGGRIGFVFQDPMTSLNPVLTVGRQISEVLRRHKGMSKAAAWRRAGELLDLVGIPDPHERLSQFPFQFSGGMRQRVMIAMGISCEPELLIADEPTTALDVTVQAQILELVRDLKQRLGMTVIWITHDMGVVAGMADTVQVMYGGRIMERGPVETVFDDPRSAYTWSLLQSLPHRQIEAGARLYQIPGQPPDLQLSPKGDPFAPRNRFSTPRCFEEMPPLVSVCGSDPRHLVAAWYDLPACIGGLRT
jgi:oligopeptide/dipeptide ABC transporter ATP-binding protein